jgi:hypothetical protein
VPATLTIWVDDDACPRDILEVLLRASERRGLSVVRVANRALPSSSSPLVRCVRVGAAFDAADRCIEDGVAPGDLVVTSDVPLAAAIVARGALGLSPRGEVFNEDNVGGKLATRDLLNELRSAGAILGGPAALAPGDRRRFADALDRLLTRRAGRG